MLSRAHRPSAPHSYVYSRSVARTEATNALFLEGFTPQRLFLGFKNAAPAVDVGCSNLRSCGRGLLKIQADSSVPHNVKESIACPCMDCVLGAIGKQDGVHAPLVKLVKTWHLDLASGAIVMPPQLSGFHPASLDPLGFLPMAASNAKGYADRRHRHAHSRVLDMRPQGVTGTPYERHRVASAGLERLYFLLLAPLPAAHQPPNTCNFLVQRLDANVTTQEELSVLEARLAAWYGDYIAAHGPAPAPPPVPAHGFEEQADHAAQQEQQHAQAADGAGVPDVFFDFGEEPFGAAEQQGQEQQGQEQQAPEQQEGIQQGGVAGDDEGEDVEWFYHPDLFAPLPPAQQGQAGFHDDPAASERQAHGRD